MPQDQESKEDYSAEAQEIRKMVLAGEDESLVKAWDEAKEGKLSVVSAGVNNQIFETRISSDRHECDPGYCANCGATEEDRLQIEVLGEIESEE